MISFVIYFNFNLAAVRYSAVCFEQIYGIVQAHEKL